MRAAFCRPWTPPSKRRGPFVRHVPIYAARYSACVAGGGNTPHRVTDVCFLCFCNIPRSMRARGALFCPIPVAPFVWYAFVFFPFSRPHGACLAREVHTILCPFFCSSASPSSTLCDCPCLACEGGGRERRVFFCRIEQWRRGGAPLFFRFFLLRVSFARLLFSWRVCARTPAAFNFFFFGPLSLSLSPPARFCSAFAFFFSSFLVCVV